MSYSQNQSLAEVQYQLRVAASNLELDAHLAAFTVPEARQSLPGYLHLHSVRQFVSNGNEYEINADEGTFSEMHIHGLQMKAFSYTRNKFGLSPNIQMARSRNTEGMWRIRTELQLGLQAAKAIMAEPFFSYDDKNSGIIPMYYTIPNPIGDDDSKNGNQIKGALKRLQEYLDSKPVGIVDELMLVKASMQQQSIRNRARAKLMKMSAVPSERDILTDDSGTELSVTDEYENYG